MQWLSLGLPTRMAVDGMRAAVVGGSWIPTALLLAATTVVALFLSSWLFSCALRRARRTGTLTMA